MDTKHFILRDSSVKQVACTAINGVKTDPQIYDLEKPHCDKAKEYKDVRGKTRYRCSHEPDLYEVLIREHKKNRSLAQNSLLWKWLTEISKFLDIEHGIEATPADLKTEFQERFLGYRVFVKSDGSFGEVLKGTSELNTAQFSEFLQRIDVYCGAELGLKLPHPEDIYYEALGKAA